MQLTSQQKNQSMVTNFLKYLISVWLIILGLIYFYSYYQTLSYPNYGEAAFFIFYGLLIVGIFSVICGIVVLLGNKQWPYVISVIIAVITTWSFWWFNRIIALTSFVLFGLSIYLFIQKRKKG